MNIKNTLIAVLATVTSICFTSQLLARSYQSFQCVDNHIVVNTTDGYYQFYPRFEHSVEVVLRKKDTKPIASLSLTEPAPAINCDNESQSNDDVLSVQIDDSERQLRLDLGQLIIQIDKDPFAIQYYNNDTYLFTEESFYIHDTQTGFRLQVANDEQFFGGGMRVAGMDRRGQTFPLYNKASYGYNGESNQMYYSLPAITSSKRYSVYYDNVAKGTLDIAASEPNIISFYSQGGRSAYVVTIADKFVDLTQQLAELVGMQPLPPIWALGNFASRFGYRSQAEVEQTAALFRNKNIALDAIVIDLYWFGKDIKGHMGNLDWDDANFPTPKAMIDNLRQQNIHTILITEPFILTTSKNWQDAVENNALMTNLGGTKPKQFDFYFGRTGLVDIFDNNASEWFWQKVKPRIDEGISGLWGDLGEPEVHPEDGLHKGGTANELHNGYGHIWAKSFYLAMQRDFPQMRPFILMRSGFIGSQKWGIIPWTGDVDRSWGGLQQQVEIALQMSIYGLGYIHSDLGGFAGGSKFDRELYIRWMQFGTFTPVYRPHAQDHIPSEPVYHSKKVIRAVAPYINLRYRLLPYHYTLAWKNATIGTPMMQPLIFMTEDNADFDNKDSYLWGDAFLVHPIVQPKQKRAKIYLPKGEWYDYFRATRYQGGQSIDYKVGKDLPVFVKAGAIVPFAKDMQSTAEFNREYLQLQVYLNANGQAKGEYYEDDGLDPNALVNQQFIAVQFLMEQTNNGDYIVSITKSGAGYNGMPQSKVLEFVVNNFELPQNSKVSLADNLLFQSNSEQEFDNQTNVYYYNSVTKQLLIKFLWSYTDSKLKMYQTN